MNTPSCTDAESGGEKPQVAAAIGRMPLAVACRQPRRIRADARSRAAVYCLFFAFALTQYALAASSFSEFHRQFAVANEHYQNKEYQQALDGYLALMQSGVRDPVLFYNAGNACVKLGQKGRAVIMYERALRLNPRDVAARANLAYVQPVGSIVQPFVLWRPFLFIRDFFALNEWILIADALLLWIAIAWSLVLLLREGAVRRVIRGCLIGGVLGMAVAAGFLGGRWYVERGRHIGVIVAKEAVSRHGPSTTFGEHLRLADGTRVEILGHEGNDWLCIRPLDVPGQPERTYIPHMAVEPI